MTVYGIYRTQFFWVPYCFSEYNEAPIVGIARLSVPRIGQGHLEVK